MKLSQNELMLLKRKEANQLIGKRVIITKFDDSTVEGKIREVQISSDFLSEAEGGKLPCAFILDGKREISFQHICSMEF